MERPEVWDDPAQFKNEWLADLIERNHARILDAWAVFIRREGGPRFAIFSDAELPSLLGATLDHAVAALRSGETGPVTVYIRDLVQERARAGFEAHEILRSVRASRNIIMGLVDETPAEFPTKHHAFAAILHLYDLATLQLSRVFQEEQSAQRARLEALHELSTILSRTFDLNRVLDAAVRKVAEVTRAAAAAVGLIGEDERSKRVAASWGVSSELEAVLPAICGVLECIVPLVQELGAKERVRSVPDIRAHESLAPWRDLLVAEGCLAIACTPLIAQERVVGGLVIFFPDAREVTDPDTDFMLALAGHIATSIRNARLFEEAKGKRELRLLLDAGKLFASSLDLHEVLTQVVRLAVESVGADFGGVMMPCEPEGLLKGAAYYARNAESEKALELIKGVYESPGIPIEGSVSGGLFISREPMLVEDYSHFDGALKELAGIIGGALFVPIKLREEVLGLFGIVSLHPGAFDEDDLQLLMGLADAAAIAIENARLYERQKNIAETLQKSFLPADLPQIPGYELAARYRAALTEAEVGGDFYDVFSVGPNLTALLVADVSGKGLTAATYTAMGKYMVRAYATEDPSPSRVLKLFNKALSAFLPTGVFITAFYAVLDAEKHTLAYANAGHDQPMVFLRKQGYMTRLDLTGPGLGVIPDAEFGARQMTLEPGDSMLVYTDGATDIKRDGWRLTTDGLEPMFFRNVGRSAGSAVDRLFDEILDYGEGHLEDDIVLMVLKRRND